MNERALRAIATVLALAPTVCFAANPLGPGRLTWIVSAGAYMAMLNTSISGAPDAATLLDAYFNTTSTYVIVYNEANGAINKSAFYDQVRQGLPRANLVVDVVNESTLETYLGNGPIDANVGAIMYDDEAEPHGRPRRPKNPIPHITYRKPGLPSMRTTSSMVRT